MSTYLCTFISILRFSFFFSFIHNSNMIVSQMTIFKVLQAVLWLLRQNTAIGTRFRFLVHKLLIEKFRCVQSVYDEFVITRIVIKEVGSAFERFRASFINHFFFATA